jgi:DNA polymerase V
MSKPALLRHLPQIAHVDLNCFYASAERALDPSLENDGHAVTRSPRAKPWHPDGRALVQPAPRAKEWGLVALSGMLGLG